MRGCNAVVVVVVIARYVASLPGTNERTTIGSDRMNASHPIDAIARVGLSRRTSADDERPDRRRRRRDVFMNLPERRHDAYFIPLGTSPIRYT